MCEIEGNDPVYTVAHQECVDFKMNRCSVTVFFD